MSTLNFTAKEILPALLDKSKTQTIRPAWTELKVHKITDLMKNSATAKPVLSLGNVNKPPRFKVGQIVPMFWGQRRPKGTKFCRKCGNVWCRCQKECKNFGKPLYQEFCFEKNIGKVEITDVFKIEMGKDKSFTGDFWLSITDDVHPVLGLTYHDSYGIGDELPESIAKKDGFQSASAMFIYFDEQYDLSTPKQFHVYRWRWL